MANFTHTVINKIRHDKNLLAEVSVCQLLLDIRKQLKGLVSIIDDIIQDCKASGYPSGFSQESYTNMKQMAAHLLWLIPFEKINQVLNAKKKGTSDQANKNELGFLDYQHHMEDLEGSEDSLEDGLKSLNCANSTLKGEYKHKAELERLISIIRKFLVSNRITFEEVLDLVAFRTNSNFLEEFKNCLGIDPEDAIIEKIFQHMKKADILQFSKGEDDLEDGNTQSLVNFLKDASLLEKEVMTYKLRETTIFLQVDLKKRLEALWPNQASLQYHSQDVFMTNSVNENYIQMLQDYSRYLLDEKNDEKDLEPWVVRIKERIMMFDLQDDVVKFMRHLQTTFIKSKRKYDLLKLFNCMLEISLPVNSSEDDDSKEIRAYRWLQNLMMDSEVSTLCLSSINQSSEPKNVKVACEVLCKMLLFGNHAVQVKIFTTLKADIFTKDIFYYIKNRLLTFNAKKDSESTKEETKSMKSILLMLKYFCDNCYLGFQNYLRSQAFDNQRDNPFSVDVVTCVADFLVHIKKDQTVGTDNDELVKVVINTLTEFVLGPCQENQRILIENKKVLDTVNSILNCDLSLRSSHSFSQSTVSKSEILQETAIFIESLIVGNQNIDSLMTLVDHLNKDWMINKVIEIYMCKVKGSKREILLDKFCHRVSNPNSEPEVDERKFEKEHCTDYYCRDGYRTLLEKILVDTCFKFFLIMQQLEDKLSNHPSIVGFKYHKVQSMIRNPLVEDILFGGKVTLKANNKIVKPTAAVENPSLAGLHSDDDEEENKKIKVRRSFIQESSFFKKKGPRRTRKHKKMLSVLLKGNPLAEDIQKVEISASKEIREADINDEYIESYKRMLFNEARQFFLSYLSCVEVLEEGELVKVQFQIPYFCKYITESIKESIIWNTVRSSDQERLEMFLSKISKYEYQMKRRQSISSRKWLYMIIDNSKLAKRMNFLLLIIINIILIIAVVHEVQVTDNSSNAAQTEDSSGKVWQNYLVSQIHAGFDNKIESRYRSGLIFLEVFQLILCIANYFLVLYETVPVILFNHLLSEQAKSFRSSQRVQIFDRASNEEGNRLSLERISRPKKVWIVCTDLTNIYNTLLVIMSIIALSGYKLFYAILLFDLATISSSMKRTVAGLVNNYKIILRSGGLLIVLTYFMSIVGFEYFPHVFNRVD